MNQTNQHDNKPLIRAALGGTAVALAMVGAALFWVSLQNKQRAIPSNVVVKTEIAKPVQAVVLPDANAASVDLLTNEPKGVTAPDSAFSTTPKRVKSLSIETKAD